MECLTLNNVLKCIPYSITCFNLKSSFYTLVIKMLFFLIIAQKFEMFEWFPVGQPETKQIE